MKASHKNHKENTFKNQLNIFSFEESFFIRSILYAELAANHELYCGEYNFFIDSYLSMEENIKNLSNEKIFGMKKANETVTNVEKKITNIYRDISEFYNNLSLDFKKINKVNFFGESEKRKFADLISNRNKLFPKISNILNRLFAKKINQDEQKLIEIIDKNIQLKKSEYESCLKKIRNNAYFMKKKISDIENLDSDLLPYYQILNKMLKIENRIFTAPKKTEKQKDIATDNINNMVRSPQISTQNLKRKNHQI